MQSVLLETGAPFGRLRPAPPALRWGLLRGSLSPWDDQEIPALELMYEGYLLHYRRSRVLATAEGEVETALLAGDVFYARGLRLIAGVGRLDAVLVLTRLMSTCSYLRSVDAPLAADDVLWASTTAGLVALANGVSCRDVRAVFDEVDDGLRRGASVDVAEVALRAVPRLRLVAPAPLLTELERAGGRAIVQGMTGRHDGR